MGVQGRFKPEPQPYSHVVQQIFWHSLESTLEGILVKFLRAMYVNPYNHTLRNRYWILILIFPKKIILQMLKSKLA